MKKIIYLVPDPKFIPSLKENFKKIGFTKYDEIEFLHPNQINNLEKNSIIFFPGYKGTNEILKNVALMNKKIGGINIRVEIDQNNPQLKEIDYSHAFNNNLTQILNIIIRESEKDEKDFVKKMEEVAQEFKEEHHLGRVVCIYSAKGGVGKTSTTQIIGEGTQFFMKKDKIKKICVDFNVEQGSFSKKFVQTPGEYKFELLIDAFKENADDNQLKELLKSVIVENPNFKFSNIEFPCHVLFAPSENKSKHSIEIYKLREFAPKILSMLREMYDLVICDCTNAKTSLNYQLFNYVDSILLVINTDKNSIDENEEFIREVLRPEQKDKVKIIFNEHDEEDLDVKDQRIINSMFSIPEDTREMKEFIDNRLIIFPKIPSYRRISNRRDAVFNKEAKYLTAECKAAYIMSMKKLFSQIVPALVTYDQDIKIETEKKGIIDKFLGKLLK